MGKIVVPEGMLAAAKLGTSGDCRADVHLVVKAALIWLSENTIRPDYDQIWAMTLHLQQTNRGCSAEDFCEEWQRRMFLAPEPEVPEEVKDLLWVQSVHTHFSADYVNTTIIEAYRRGQKSQTEKAI